MSLVYQRGKLKICLVNRLSSDQQRRDAINKLSQSCQAGVVATVSATLDNIDGCNARVPQVFLLETPEYNHAGHAYFELEGYSKRHWKWYEIWIHPRLRRHHLAEFLCDAAFQYLGQSYSTVEYYDFHPGSKVSGLLQKREVAFRNGVPSPELHYLSDMEARAFDKDQHSITVEPPDELR